MDELVNSALKNYFHHLKNFGYINYHQVYKLLAFSLLNDYLSLKDTTLEEKEEILKAMRCVSGNSCLLYH